MGKHFRLATLAAKAKKSAQTTESHFRVTPTTKLLFVLCGVGAILLVVAAVLDTQGVDLAQANGLRWLYLFGCVLTAMLLWSCFVDVAHAWLELRFFLRLAMLPSSQLLHKVWLNVLGAYIAFRRLFTAATLAGQPPGPLSEAETWVQRLLLCALLFSCVCVAVALGCFATVAALYSEGSRQKLVAALQHEYVMYRLVRDKVREDERAAVSNPDSPHRLSLYGTLDQPQQQQRQRRGTYQGLLAAAAAAVGGQWLTERLSAASQGAAAVAPTAAAATGTVMATVSEAPSDGLKAGSGGGGGGGHGEPVRVDARSRVQVTFAATDPMCHAPPTASAVRGSEAVGSALALASGLPRVSARSHAEQHGGSGGGGAPAARSEPMLGAIIVAAADGRPSAAGPNATGGSLVAADGATAAAHSNQSGGGGNEADLDPDPSSDSGSDLLDLNGSGGGANGAAGRAEPLLAQSSSSGLRLRRRSFGVAGGGGDAFGSAGGGANRSRRRSGTQSSASSYADLNQAMRDIDQTDTVHLRRTMLAALEMYEYLREQQSAGSGGAGGGGGAGLPTHGSVVPGAGGGAAGAAAGAGGGIGSLFHGPVSAAASSPHAMVMRELAAMRRSGVRQMINPRWLLDELLMVYGSLSDADVPMLAGHFADAVWECAAPEGDCLRPEDFLHIFPKEDDRRIAWDALDGNKDGILTRAKVVAAVSTFLSQERSMALNVRAIRRLTVSLTTSLAAIINGVFLMVAYLSILDVAQFFRGGSGSSNKTSLDIFSVYMLAVTLIFSEQVKAVLSGCMLILHQQPFDVGEELVIEESPGWRVMGIVQDFSLFFLRIKKSTDGELVTLPLNKLVTGRFTNLTRSDWKIEQNYFAVDISTPLEVLSVIQEAALAVVRSAPGEYDASYGFLAVFHGFERPGKVLIRTFHRYKFNLSAPHKRIALARQGVMNAVRQTLDKCGIGYTELRLHAPLLPASLPYPPGTEAIAAAAAAAAAVAANVTDAYGNAGPPGAAAPAAL